MDDNMLESLRSFDGVWSRVTGGETPAAGTPEDLRRLMCGAARLCESLRALACKLRSCSARLNRLADGEDNIIRRLRAEFFLLTGETCTPGAACAWAPCTLDALRSAYMAAGDSAADFTASARRAPAGTAQLLDKFAAQQRCAARELKELILKAMGAIST